MRNLPMRPLQTEIPESRQHPESDPLKKRASLITAGSGFVIDRIFCWAMLVAALSILGIVLLIVSQLYFQSKLSIAQFGWKFFSTSNWDPVSGDFGALPFIYGTLVSSALALAIAVPLGVGVAIFMNEMCPRAFRSAFSYLVELLAAIPSVIYGLWGIFVLVPIMRHYVEPFLFKYFSWSGFFSGPMYGIGMLPASVILAIMIVPFISSSPAKSCWRFRNHSGKRHWRWAPHDGRCCASVFCAMHDSASLAA